MKNLTFLLCVVALSFSPLIAAVPGELDIPHITVTGTALTEAVPDKLAWSLELRNTGLELPKVADKHANLSMETLKALKELGIEEKDTQTSRMEFGENMVYRDHSRVREGYFASTQISFKLADLAKYKDVWLRLAAMSSLSVKSVAFDHSNRIELRKETRRKALLAAKEKAEAMAEVLNAKVGDVLSISEDVGTQSLAGGNAYLSNNINYNGIAQAEGRDDDAGTGGTIAPGTIPISIHVVVSFRLLNAGG